jgi:hypothetical protein
MQLEFNCQEGFAENFGECGAATGESELNKGHCVVPFGTVLCYGMT